MKHFTETGKYRKSSLSKKKIFFKKPTHSCIESLNYLYIILLNCNMLEIIKLFQILHWSISVTAMTYFKQSNWSISVAQMVFFFQTFQVQGWNTIKPDWTAQILADLCFSIVYAFICHTVGTKRTWCNEILIITFILQSLCCIILKNISAFNCLSILCFTSCLL